MKLIVRLLAFFGKELNEVRRQPRLVLSLLLGPFLILLLFGLGYQGTRPPLRIAIVMPPDLAGDERAERVVSVLSDNFDVRTVEAEEEPALRMLGAGEVDLVEVFPADFAGYLARGERAPLRFIYDEINPQIDQYIQYSAYTQVEAINEIFLIESVTELQSEAAAGRDLITQTRTALDTLESDPTDSERAAAQETLRSTSNALGILAASPALAATGASQDEAAAASQDLIALRDELDSIDQALSEDSLDDGDDRLGSARSRLDAAEDTVTRLSELSPTVIVAPLQQMNENVQGAPLDLMIYFAPGVVALILQHIAVTLGALSIIRERLRGSLEFFRVSPVSMLQVIVGKYLAYLVFGGLIAAALVALMIFALGVPFLGPIWPFVGLLALFLLAAIGEGLLISVLSNSDTQAVQFSMLVLLLSIFFSGFILPLDQFTAPVSYTGYVVPMTPAQAGMQSLMLFGHLPEQWVWVTLGSIAAISFLLVLLIGRAQFRRAV